MNNEKDGIGGLDLDVAQEGVQAIAVAAELTERVHDPSRPVHARYEAVAFKVSGTIPERHLDQPGNAVTSAMDQPVCEGVHFTLGAVGYGLEVIPADDAK